MKPPTMPSRARAIDAGLLLFVSGQHVDEEFTEDGSHEISVRANNLLQSSEPPILGLTKAMQEALVERPPHSLQGCTPATAPVVPAMPSFISFDERASPHGDERCVRNLAPRIEEEDEARELEAPRHARIETKSNAERGRNFPRSHIRLSRDTGEKHASMAAAAAAPLWRDSWSDDGGSLDSRGFPQPVWRDSDRARGAAFCGYILFSTPPEKSPSENVSQLRTVASSSVGNRAAFVSPRSPRERMLWLEAAEDDSGSSIGGGGASMPRERRACGAHSAPLHHASSRVANNPPRRRKEKKGECRERCQRSGEAGVGETIWKDTTEDIQRTNTRSQGPDRKESALFRESRGAGLVGAPRSDRRGYDRPGSCQQLIGDRLPQAFVFLCPSVESPGATPAISRKRHMHGRQIRKTAVKK